MSSLSTNRRRWTVVWKHQPLRPSRGRVSPCLRAQREQLLRKEGKKQTETNRWRADGRIITHRCFPEAAASVPRLNQQLDLWDGTGPPLLAALTSNKKLRLSLKGEEGEERGRRGAHQPSTRAAIASIWLFFPHKKNPAQIESSGGNFTE